MLMLGHEGWLEFDHGSGDRVVSIKVELQPMYVRIEDLHELLIFIDAFLGSKENYLPV